MGLIDFIFPKKCLECGSEGKYICEDCLGKVGTGGILGNTIFLFKYEGVVRKAIIALKYKFSTGIANELAVVCLKELVKYNLPPKALLVPIPLHWYKKNLRGFNQSEEVGRIIADKMGWDFIPDLIVKNKQTKSQVELRGQARRKNLRGTFVLNPNVGFRNNNVFVFDDVYTTGSTIKEAIGVINSHGDLKVWGLTIAR